MSSHAWITRLKPGRGADYARAHRMVPPEVATAIRDAGIKRYTIFRHDDALIGVFDTDDLAGTIRRLVDSPVLQRWRAAMDEFIEHEAEAASGFRPLLPIVWRLGEEHGKEAQTGPQLRPLAAPAIGGFDDLRGKAVLVTGASTGIGAAVALAFGGCGAKVAVHYNRSAAEAEAVAQAVRKAGGAAVTVQADLANPRNAGPLVERAAAALGGLDVLINNAGHVLGRTPIAETSDERFHAIMDLNFTSLFMACRAAVPLMRKAGGGAIVNTSSVAARIGGGPGAALYGAAKAAVSNFSRGLAKELVHDRIRVNVVAPGVIETPLHVALTPPDAWARFISVVPMGRAGSAEECAGAYLYLASERLSSYVTGQVIEVNGGQLMP
jgi:3-oxoacyl-[acyl-carrier protein] reductase